MAAVEHQTSNPAAEKLQVDLGTVLKASSMTPKQIENGLNVLLRTPLLVHQIDGSFVRYTKENLHELYTVADGRTKTVLPEYVLLLLANWNAMTPMNCTVVDESELDDKLTFTGGVDSTPHFPDLSDASEVLLLQRLPADGSIPYERYKLSTVRQVNQFQKPSPPADEVPSIDTKSCQLEFALECVIRDDDQSPGKAVIEDVQLFRKAVQAKDAKDTSSVLSASGYDLVSNTYQPAICFQDPNGWSATLFNEDDSFVDRVSGEIKNALSNSSALGYESDNSTVSPSATESTGDESEADSVSSEKLAPSTPFLTTPRVLVGSAFISLGMIAYLQYVPSSYQLPWLVDNPHTKFYSQEVLAMVILVLLAFAVVCSCSNRHVKDNQALGSTSDSSSSYSGSGKY